MSSALAIRVPSAIYREEQRFGWWLYALVAILLGLGWAFLALRHEAMPAADAPLDGGRFQFSLGVTLGIAIPGVLILGVLKLTTEVRPDGVHVWFGWIPTYRKVIPIGEIQSVEVVRFRPIRDHGGWGFRTSRAGDRVLSARGDQGVMLRLADGSRVIVGSQRPDPLAAAIDDVMLKRAV
ncbi:MAG: hypothetical protein SFX72_20855 [Isosphaeraceae bacterium]|nr:hypothetical protein [Isosphaeraceae bacterium]